MTWRLRRETAGSGALGDLASHAVDQLSYLLGEQVTGVSGRLHTFVDERPGRRRARARHRRRRRLGHAANRGRRVASLEVSRMATGRKNCLQIEVYGTRGRSSFDLRAPQRAPGRTSTRRAARRPAAACWSPSPSTPTSARGGRRATCSAGTTRSPTRPRTSSPPSRPGPARARPSPTGSPCSGCSRAIEESAAQVGGARRHPSATESGGALMARPSPCSPASGPTCTLEEVAGLAAGWGYDGLEIAVSGEHLDAWRWDDDDYVEERLDVLRPARPRRSGRSPTTSRARPSATTRSTTATKRSSAPRSGATATPKASGSAPPRS